MLDGETSGPLFVRCVMQKRTGTSALSAVLVCVMAGKTENIVFFPYFSVPSVVCPKGF